jgi:hypothetical protein
LPGLRALKFGSPGKRVAERGDEILFICDRLISLAEGCLVMVFPAKRRTEPLFDFPSSFAVLDQELGKIAKNISFFKYTNVNENTEFKRENEKNK